MISSEGWVEVMWSGTDSTAINYNPIRNNKPISAFYFIIFMIVGHLFILNLFVGVVIDTFDRERERLGKNHLMTPT